MTKIKEKAIAKGKWPGRAADKSIAKEEEEEEYNEYLSETATHAVKFKLSVGISELVTAAAPSPSLPWRDPIGLAP
eukprot:1158579-Pelagomonas_calceolata.AAC.1